MSKVFYPLTKRAEDQLSQQHIGTGWLVLKTGPQTLMRVEVFQKPDGSLYRIYDGKPALPVSLEPEQDTSPAVPTVSLPTVTRAECTSIAMVVRNEKRFTVIVLDGRKQRWVGFGWVDEGPATEADRQRYPTVID